MNIERLGRAIGYPETLSGSAVTLKVDGGDVRVREDGGRIVFERTVCHPGDGSDSLVRLAGYSAGRVLKEEAQLAWDPRAEEMILWQAVPSNAADAVLKRAFEVFCTSCDWWLARVNDEGSAVPSFPEMVIRP